METSFVKIISQDEREFIFDERIANLCKRFTEIIAINKSDPNKRSEEALTLNYDSINGDVMEIIVQYLHYKARYMNTPKNQIPEFPIPTQLGLQVLIAAEQLGI